MCHNVTKCQVKHSVNELTACVFYIFTQLYYVNEFVCICTCILLPLTMCHNTTKCQVKHSINELTACAFHIFTQFYYVNQFVCICTYILLLCSFMLFYNAFLTLLGILSHLLLFDLAIYYSFPSEYISAQLGSEVSGALVSYTSILSLSGLWTACPNLVLITLSLGSYIFPLVVLGSSAITAHSDCLACLFCLLLVTLFCPVKGILSFLCLPQVLLSCPVMGVVSLSPFPDYLKPSTVFPLFYCLCLQFGHPGCLYWYCLHKYILQPPFHFLYLLT